MLLKRLALVCVAAAMLAGCTTRTFYTTEHLTRAKGAPRILVMPPDVELSEVTAGGMNEVNALWTKQGRDNIKDALREHMRSINAHFTLYDDTDEATPERERLVQLQKLHGAVAATVATHHFIDAQRLPSKAGKFDWSLGPEVTALGKRANAEYALFTHVRDSYASSGRVAVMIVSALVFGVAVQGGAQVGYATLVDLKTGEVVWFNVLARGDGDLRTRGPATESVAKLLTGMPK